MWRTASVNFKSPESRAMVSKTALSALGVYAPDIGVYTPDSRRDGVKETGGDFHPRCEPPVDL